MSYDVLFVRPDPSDDPLGSARELAGREFDGETESPVSPEADERRRRLIQDLLSLDPSMAFHPTDGGASQGGWIDSEDENYPFPVIELGIDSGSISISYSADASAVAAITPIVAIFARHGYVAYDPQTDSLLQSVAAEVQFESTARGVIEKLEARGETVIGHGRVAKPWWKFW